MTINVKHGDTGTNAKIVQKMLNRNGYSLDVDGIIGDNTVEAIKDYQQKNGLTVDGIVGQDTWQSLAGETQTTSTTPATNPNTKGTNTYRYTSAPKLNPLPSKPTYDTSLWGDSTKGQDAWDAYTKAQEAVGQHGKKFTYDNQQQLNDLIAKILNGEDFKYDLNGDALYQQFKDKHIQQGKMAMSDAIGQASAMTGGYGNSYAQSVGQQMYQKELQNLNDVIPELYQMALDKHKMERQNLYDQYGMLSDDYTRKYGEWDDTYSKLMDALGLARSDYYDGADMFYTERSNKNNIASREFDDAMTIWNSESDSAWKKAEWDEAARQRGEDIAYRAERDKLEDEQWQAENFAALLNRAKVADDVDVEPKETERTQAFINRYKSKSEYLAEGHNKKEWTEYMESNIASFLRNDRIDESEAQYLIEYYGLE